VRGGGFEGGGGSGFAWSDIGVEGELLAKGYNGGGVAGYFGGR
jgi:hypothetical protein